MEAPAFGGSYGLEHDEQELDLRSWPGGEGGPMPSVTCYRI